MVCEHIDSCMMKVSEHTYRNACLLQFFLTYCPKNTQKNYKTPPEWCKSIFKAKKENR